MGYSSTYLSVFLACLVIAAGTIPRSEGQTPAHDVTHQLTFREGDTFLLGANNATTTVPVPLVVGSGEQISQATVLISTPAVGGTGATFASMGVSGTPRLWTWPSALGVSTIPTLSVHNGTLGGTIMVPPSTVYSGSALLESLSGELRGDYTLSLSLGSQSLVNRSGLIGFSSPTVLPWLENTDPITSVVLGPSTNGSQLLAVGDEQGYLQVYSMEPDGAGLPVFSNPVAPPEPLQSIAFVDVKNNGVYSILTSDGKTIQLIAPGAAGPWNVLNLLSQSTALAGTTLIHEENGRAAIVGAGLTQTLVISNDTGTGPAGGWENPLVPLATLPGTPSGIRSATLSNGSSELGVSVGGAVEIYSFQSTGMAFLHSVTLPLGVAVNDFEFGQGGIGVLIAGSDGKLYVASAPAWQSVDSSSISSDSPLLGVARATSDNNSLAIDATGSFRLIRNVFDSQPPPSQLLGMISQPSGGETLGFGSFYGTGEEDAYVAGGANLWVVENESVFNSTTLPLWGHDFQNAINSSTSETDSYGNLVKAIPYSLSVGGGGAQLVGATAYYNYTFSVDATHPVESFHSNFPRSKILNLTLAAKSPGYLHFEVIITTSTIPPPTLWSNLATWMAHSLQYILVATLLMGVAVFTLGSLKYHQSKSSRPPPRPKVPEEGR